MKDAIRSTRQSRTDGLHAASQRQTMRRLDEQMHVVRLKRIVHDAEVAALAGLAEASFESADELRGTKRWDARPDAERDVCGMARSKVGTRCMR